MRKDECRDCGARLKKVRLPRGFIAHKICPVVRAAMLRAAQGTPKPKRGKRPSARPVEATSAVGQ